MYIRINPPPVELRRAELPSPSVARCRGSAETEMLPPSAASAAVWWMDGCRESARLEPTRTCATSRARTHALRLRLARSRRVTRVAMSSLARQSPWQPLSSDLNIVLLNTKKGGEIKPSNAYWSCIFRTEKNGINPPFLFGRDLHLLPRRNVRY